MHFRKMSIKKLLIVVAVFLSQTSFAGQSHFFSNGNFVFQLGGFGVYQGKAQDIIIDELVGDHFTVEKHWDGNLLLGLGYFVHGPDETFFGCDCPIFCTQFGINAFYFPKTHVKGDVIQEELYTNLSYRYAVTNFPIYLDAKAIFNNGSNSNYNITLDLGAGMNVVHVSDFKESSIDGGITLPDHIFESNTHATLSATAGIGVKFNNSTMPFECGYRFFYLGEGHFDTATSVTTALHTGNVYANAILCSVSV